MRDLGRGGRRRAFSSSSPSKKMVSVGAAFSPPLPSRSSSAGPDSPESFFSFSISRKVRIRALGSFCESRTPTFVLRCSRLTSSAFFACFRVNYFSDFLSSVTALVWFSHVCFFPPTMVPSFLFGRIVWRTFSPRLGHQEQIILKCDELFVRFQFSLNCFQDCVLTQTEKKRSSLSHRFVCMRRARTEGISLPLVTFASPTACSCVVRTCLVDLIDGVCSEIVQKHLRPLKLGHCVSLSFAKQTWANQISTFAHPNWANRF